VGDGSIARAVAIDKSNYELDSIVAKVLQALILMTMCKTRYPDPRLYI